MQFPQSTTISVTVKPNAKATGVSFDHGAITVRVTQPPTEGKANIACRKALAKALGVVAPTTVKLLRGAHRHVKVFELTSLTPAELSARLSRMRP